MSLPPEYWLWLIRALPDPAVSTAPRVLGVDESALRRYGTVLVDVETRRPAGILPERSADSFAAWLADRPGTQVICRDRAGVCSDGGARGAPGAVQVADRWHLWHNLAEAVGRAVARHREHLAAAASADGLSRNTVRRFARAADPGELLVSDWTPRTASILHDYETCLRERWNSGCTNATALWQQIRARGYPGGYSGVRDYLARFRGNAAMPAPAPEPPTPRAVPAWIMTRPGDLDPATRPA